MTVKTTTALALSLFASGCGVLSEEVDWGRALHVGPSSRNEDRAESGVPVTDATDSESGAVAGARLGAPPSNLDIFPTDALLDSGVWPGAKDDPNADRADLESYGFRYFDADYFGSLSEVPFDISFDSLTNHLLFGASFRF